MDIGFNNGCASHFNCNNVFRQFTCRLVTTAIVFSETSHGKSKSDGLSGFVKCFTTYKVYERQVVTCNALALFEFCSENLVPNRRI